MVKLLPCPLCGGEAYFRKPVKEKNSAMCSVSVEYKQCGASPYATLTYAYLPETEMQEAAARHWNRRMEK